MRHALSFSLAAVLAGGALAGQAQAVFLLPTVVPATGSGANANTTVVALGSVSTADSFNVQASGTAYLQTANANPPQPSYGTNAAGVETVLGIPQGGYPGSIGNTLQINSGTYNGFYYGAIVATLTDLVTNATQTAQIFATNAANGAGSATPPSTVSYNGTLGSLFGNFTAGNKTLTLSVADTGYDDNAGSFTLSSVPEASTWVAMVLGFGLIGTSLRRRRTSVSFA